MSSEEPAHAATLAWVAGIVEARRDGVPADQLGRLIDALAPHDAGLEPVRRRLADALFALSPPLRGPSETLSQGAVHELNNVISAIVGRAELLRRSIVEPLATRSVDVIAQAALDGSRIVRRIRSRLRGEPEARGVPLDLEQILRDVALRAEVRRPAEVEFEVQAAPEAWVQGDATELRQVFTNLVYNALDAMPGGGRLSLRTGRLDTLVFGEVADTGIGMDTETQRRMFEPHFTTKGERGSGLGLSVSRTIVEAHGGRIEVRSVPGEGTAVRVLLPVAEAPELPLEGTDRPRIRAKAFAGRILVVDDDPAVREVLGDMLRTQDHTVDELGSGQAALERLDANPYDLVFTDLGMPDMNGWEVAAAFKGARPQVPVVIVTGWETPLDREKMVALGVDGLLTKPFRLQELVGLVERLVPGPRSLDDEAGSRDSGATRVDVDGPISIEDEAR